MNSNNYYDHTHTHTQRERERERERESNFNFPKRNKPKSKLWLWIILGTITLAGAGTTIYLVTRPKSTETKDQSTQESVQQFQNQLSQIKNTLNQPANSTKKVKYSVQLSEIENQLKNLLQKPQEEQEKIIQQLEQKFKVINQDLGIKEDKPKERNPNNPDRKPDNPKVPPIPPSNNLETERQRMINELEKSCEEKEPKLSKKAVQKFVQQINNASLTELPTIFQQGQEFIQKKREEKEWFGLFRQEAERRAQARNADIKEIEKNSDITKLVEEIKSRPNSSFSKAKLTEKEVKDCFFSGIPSHDIPLWNKYIIPLAKEKLRKSKFPEFLLVCEKKFYEDDWEVVKEDYFQGIIDMLKVEFSQTNADIENSFKDITHLASNPSGLKEEKFIEWGIEHCLIYVKYSLLKDIWKNIHLLAKKPCVFKSFQPDKNGVEYRIKTSPVQLLTPRYLEDDKTIDYSSMTEEQLKAEIKASRFFDEEYVN